jgi:GNAT superfamily N-acetyltransferase
MPTLESLSPHLVTELKTVRLRALQDTPSAFGRTYAEEALLSEADWLNRATAWNNGSSSICFIAMDNNAPCGMIAGYLDAHNPPGPNVAAMWVAPEYRRTGLGTLLMNEVVQWAQRYGTGGLCLMVTGGNAAAIRFYERCGFVMTGNTEPYANDPTVFECEMIKPL